MSELMDVCENRNHLKWHLLATASASALWVAIASTVNAAEDNDRPTVWIELGGQLDRISREQDIYSPSFVANITQPDQRSALNVQQPTSAIGVEGKISIQPNATDWVFSASIQYGRSNANRHRHQQTANKIVPVAAFHFNPPFSAFHVGPYSYYPTRHVKFADGQDKQSETHTVIDFQAGRDIGIGLFGRYSTSQLSAGVRIAQFTSKSNIGLHAEPDVHYPTAPIASKYEWVAFRSSKPEFHDYSGALTSRRSFHGIGPSLAWNSSTSLFGDKASGDVSIDAGFNIAVLFGRQNASGNHQTAVHYYHPTRGWSAPRLSHLKPSPGYFAGEVTQTCHGLRLGTAVGPDTCQTNSAGFTRARTVTVPNLGGFAGVTYRLEDFKVSLGYRADFFFGAMDTGIDTRQTKNIGFYGPFASVSIGLGG